MWKESQSQTWTHASTGTQTSCQKTLLPHTIITIHKGILYPTLLCNFAQLLTLPCYFLFDHWHRRTQMHMHTDSSGSFFPYRTGAWTNQSSLSRGDALSSRGVHMKEQQNIKECPRIHCSAQCEDNLALMENLDQRPGLHNCTFPNKHCAIWRVGQTSGLLRPAPVHRHRQHHSFHLAMFSISMSR